MRKVELKLIEAIRSLIANGLESADREVKISKSVMVSRTKTSAGFAICVYLYKHLICVSEYVHSGVSNRRFCNLHLCHHTYHTDMTTRYLNTCTTAILGDRTSLRFAIRKGLISYSQGQSTYLEMPLQVSLSVDVSSHNPCVVKLQTSDEYMPVSFSPSTGITYEHTR